MESDKATNASTMIHRLVNSARGRLQRLRRRWDANFNLHPSIARYIRFCRQNWPQDYRKQRDSVVLVGLFLWNPSIHCYAYALNFLARKSGSTIRWFWFYPKRNFVYEKVFAAFGAKPGINFEDLSVYRAEAEKIGNELFDGLRSKWDVVNIEFDGNQIGDLIYDTYLRTAFRPTIDIKDILLRGYIIQGFQIALGVKNYLAHHRVVAVIADHPNYLFCGLLVRLACLAGIPVHQLCYGKDFYVKTLRIEGTGSVVPLYFPWPHYRELFNRLTLAEQIEGRERGRQLLESRLQGKIDGVLFGRSAYGEGGREPIFANTGRPRILVLLNDFFDAVHYFRRLLFPDFYEWINFLLEKASETPFDWYVKPHPNMLIWKKMGRASQEEASQRVHDELSAKFPKIKFLDPATSNRQIMSEGVNAVFTVHGTAGHEFAYLGVPVVNAGDNHHIAYPFNLHARSVAEYEKYIANADSLEVNMNRDDIAEFVYMNYLYFDERWRSEANPIPIEYFDTDDFESRNAGPETLDHFCKPLTAEEQQKLDAYFEQYLQYTAAPRPVSPQIAAGVPEF